MALRLVWIGSLLLLLAPTSLPAAGPDNAASPAQQLWERGQEALRLGKTDEAITCYEASLKADPGLTRNHLSLAAAYLDKGEDEKASVYLSRYVAAQPDHLIIRAHYAELLLRLNRPWAARVQFERFIADVQENEHLAEEHLIHCHSRLMEIAESEEDDYGEHLHRGIGLYLLALQRAALPEPDGDLSVEGLLCRAAGELMMARVRRPDEARPCWYLFEVWSGLAQRQPAARWLRAAEAAAPFSYLTPVERRGLELACRGRAAEAVRK
jgi:predicted Zn-dependent protease